MMKRLMEKMPVLAFGCAIALSACTSDPVDAGPETLGDAVDTTANGDSSDTSVRDGDEDDSNGVFDEPDASDDDRDADIDGDGDLENGDVEDGDAPADLGPTTPQTIVPPGETAPPSTEDLNDDGDQGGNSTTTSSPVETIDPSEQPIQEQDTALVCATVEQGYIGVLSGDSDLANLESGAQMAVASGSTDYVALGETLSSALSNESGVQEAADALLTRCEDDGFERLA